MNRKEFFEAEKLNIGFKYPIEYVEFVDNSESISNTPWWLIGNTQRAFNVSYHTINDIYNSTKLLIPFAKTDQSNMLACFDREHRVFLVSCEKNTVTNADWDNRFHFKNFNSWLEEVLSGAVC